MVLQTNMGMFALYFGANGSVDLYFELVSELF